MEVFVHFAVLERVEGGFLEGGVGGGEVGEEGREALADFEGVGHAGCGIGGVLVGGLEVGRLVCELAGGE